MTDKATELANAIAAASKRLRDEMWRSFIQGVRIKQSPASSSPRQPE